MENINSLINERSNRTKWFANDRFGMFIHWGLYSIPARGEWVRSNEEISNEEYEQYFEEFNPVNYDPKVWAKAAKNAGMKYGVLTAKHHEGFCLWDTKTTDYKAMNTKAKKDLVKEYVDAFRNEGLKVGLYFSTIDWHHKDFPAYGDRQHPMRNNEDFKDVKHDFNNYLEFMHNQVEELMSNYGKIDMLFFDFSYDDLVGEAWKATELVRMIRRLQPDIIMNSRLEGSGECYGTIMTDTPTEFAGDYATPEQIIPAEGLVSTSGESIPWEACFTMNNNWGYNSRDRRFKTSTQLIRKLVECVSKNGNMLLNIGPNAKGEIPKESLRVLEEIGEWIRENGESIYGCGFANLAKPEWGRYTRKGNKLYAHLFEESIGCINLPGLNKKIKKARILSDGSEMLIINPFTAKEFPKDAFINFGLPEWEGFPLNDEKDTVIELDMD